MAILKFSKDIATKQHVSTFQGTQAECLTSTLPPLQANFAPSTQEVRDAEYVVLIYCAHQKHSHRCHRLVPYLYFVDALDEAKSVGEGNDPQDQGSLDDCLKQLQAPNKFARYAAMERSVNTLPQVPQRYRKAVKDGQQVTDADPDIAIGCIVFDVLRGYGKFWLEHPEHEEETSMSLWLLLDIYKCQDVLRSFDLSVSDTDAILRACEKSLTIEQCLYGSNIVTVRRCLEVFSFQAQQVSSIQGASALYISLIPYAMYIASNLHMSDLSGWCSSDHCEFVHADSSAPKQLACEFDAECLRKLLGLHVGLANRVVTLAVDSEDKLCQKDSQDIVEFIQFFIDAISKPASKYAMKQVVDICSQEDACIQQLMLYYINLALQTQKVIPDTPEPAQSLCAIAQAHELHQHVLDAQNNGSGTLTDQCGSTVIQDYNMPLRIGSFFIILGTSSLGIFSPMLFDRLKGHAMFTAIKNRILMFAKFFGTGVILATAFIHMLPSAFSSFSSPCLPSGWNVYGAWAGLF
ncbi:hypothetical protein BZG36_05383, partial [Bifiguratus adelaidae]